MELFRADHLMANLPAETPKTLANLWPLVVDVSAVSSTGKSVCWPDVPAELHLAFHSDNQTHGPIPGPTETWGVNARFLFP